MGSHKNGVTAILQELATDPRLLQFQKERQGRLIAKARLSMLVAATEHVIVSGGLAGDVAVMTFGSAGGRFLVSNSDTDYILLTDANLSIKDAIGVQNMLSDALACSPWSVTFKAWERVKVNPMDLLSVRFLCGNHEIFHNRLIEDASVSGLGDANTILTTFAGIDLHLEFMASEHFSQLVRTYHPSSEFPTAISRGDVKYYIGGTRWAQAVLAAAMVCSQQRFIADADLAVLASKGVLDEEEILGFECALDFLLTVKDLCVEGSNILHERNMNHIVGILDVPAGRIVSEYTAHSQRITDVFYKTHRAVLAEHPRHEGVVARTTGDEATLSRLIDEGSLDIWKTLALRSDIPTEVRERHAKRIEDYRASNPHTMLDEMVATVRYAAGAPPSLDTGMLDENTSLWMTDQVFSSLELIPKRRVNRPHLVRRAVHDAFFELYRTGRLPDPHVFHDTFAERAAKFFHCRTIEPVGPTTVARAACRQIMGCGLFCQGRLTLLELHLTNRCNLRCTWCTYANTERRQTLPFSDLEQVINLAPREVLIVGGGEPTLYRDGDQGFNDAILALRKGLPGARLRLITNGTCIPTGNWLSEIDEVSVSLDDECAESYLSHKGKDLFETVWANIRALLYDSPVDMLRVTRVYDGESLLSNLLLAEKLFGLWSADGLDGAKKAYFTFEVFPAADDRNQHAPYASSVLSTSQKDKWTSQLRTIQEERPLFFSFLQSQTNLVHLADAVPQAPPAERCWPVTHYALVGADRRVYPCFASCSSFPATSLGPIDLPLEDLEARRRRLFSRPPLQCRAGCRPSAIFYGSRSREYHGSQIELGLPALDEEDISQPAVVHVSYHDPEHTIGGIGWAVYGLCSAQTKGRRLVYWLSPCMRGESPGEQLHQGGLLRVVKLPFTDASLSSIFGTGPDAANLRARFGELVVEYIRQHFLPSRTPIHLHGCIELPRRASDLRNLGYSVVSTFHMLLSSRTKLLGGDPALVEALRDQERRAIASSDTTTVPSVEMQEELAELCPSRRESIHCIPNGIGEEHFGTPCAQQPDTHRLIVSFGRISPEKGFDLVIQAAKMLIDSLPEGAKSTLRFHVFGNTDFTVEARRLYTEALVAAADGYPGITITATPQGITGPAKLAIIDQAIAGVVPSLYEPFGMVLPEMMARGKPVVATLTAGAKDILKTDRAGKTDFGFAVEPTADSIRGALAWMLDHPSETQIMGQNARKRARDYRWDVAASSFENLYAGRRPGAGDAPGSVLP